MNASGGTSNDILGNYKLGKNIGEGTFGKVRLGTHILTEQKVAVKTLQKDKIVQQADIERVTRQICILKILRHPNIIQLYEIIETKTAIHLIMEYAERGELFDYIVKHKRVEQTEAVRFMQQILAGVEYIHKNGIVHRDLKPENLLLDANKNIKIVDFGLSNQYKPGERLKTACGSPCYAAPEMIAGKKYECLNVDIWSCGIIIYAMLCGFLPFEDPNTSKLYKKIIAGDFQMPKILSAEARQILRKVLNVNPDTRYKIPQIRSSKWYNLYKARTQAKGIIVGKDQIIPDETVIRRMKKHDFDEAQVRTYVINNRHNHVTAMYYLMQKKMEKEPRVEDIDDERNTETPQTVTERLVSDSTKARENEEKKQAERQRERQAIEREKQRQRERQRQKEKEKEKQRQRLKELERQKQKSEEISKSQRERNREESPLIYRPEKKHDFYIPQKKNQKQTKDSSKNDSINASNIIASLVEANKGKLLTQRFNRKQPQQQQTGNFDKAEQFKVFPNKMNSSIYEPDSAKKGNLTNRSSHPDDQSYESKRSSITGQTKRFQGLNYSTELQGSEPNKKRQELSEQLKQISVKIDKQIIELKKQNQSMRSETDSTKRQPVGPYVTGISSTTNRKRNSESFTMMSSKERLKISRQFGKDGATPTNANNKSSGIYQRDRIASQGNPQPQSQLQSQSTATPKQHVGPFNVKCLFMENPSILIKKISEYLKQQGVRFIEPEPYTLRTMDNHSIWIESISSMNNLNLVNFTRNFPSNDELLEILSQ